MPRLSCAPPERPAERRRQTVGVATLNLIRRSFPDQSELSTAVSRAILIRVAAGELPPTARLHQPPREVAFGRQDVASPGYAAATAAARAAGYAAVERLAGGRAALFHEGTIAFTRAYADTEAPRRTYERFEEAAGIVAAALARLGVDARVGEVPGEYCPGAYSVNSGGERKLAGIGQRMIRGGAHVGAVLVASGEVELRRVLSPVYDALELSWDPATAGSVAGELGREVSVEELTEAMVAELAARETIEEADVDAETLELAEQLLVGADRVSISLPAPRQA
jgi:lipoate-protein ligase A